MRDYCFGKASKYALNDTTPKNRKDEGCDNCRWLFSGNTVGIWGTPSDSGMKYLNVPDDYPYPSAEIGTKEQLYRALLKGECVPASCVNSGYEYLMMGKGRKKKLLDEYFEKLPEGMYVILSVNWD